MSSAADAESIEERLERGEVVLYPAAPFALPAGPDHAFLLDQQPGGVVHKNISFNPQNGKAVGFAGHDEDQERRLVQVLGGFARAARVWLDRTLPRYAPGLEADRVSYRPEEEATRRLRHNA